MSRNPRTLLLAVAALLAAVLAAGCAARRPEVPAVHVAGTERLYLRLLSFDSALVAELSAAGIDAAALEADVRAELGYGLFLRGQEAARDSVDAAVRVDARVLHLRPGSGNTGAFAAFSLVSRRGNAKPDSVSWTHRLPARENVPEAFAALHLSRLASRELLARIRPPRKVYETPPPLHLMR